ncbi:hypothetical protein OY671_006283 [Metschnikowia pulcherrima]|nr:hypothetical protein OY671_006283 [Metschnikowia pulcherrima]
MGLFARSKSPSCKNTVPGSKHVNDSQNDKTKNVSINVETSAESSEEKKDAVSNPEDDSEEASEPKQYAKEKAPVLNKVVVDEPETETMLNTKRNALLYHTSEDSIDLYRSENNSSDLLGRLYYDDYDPDNRQIVERITSFTSLQALARQPASPGFGRPVSETEVKSTTNTLRRPSFERQVSFDTLSDTHHSAITLKVKHPEFKFRRNNKTFLIGFSNDSESLKAVEWAFLEMVISGDTIIVFQVLDEKSYTFVDPSLAEIVLEKLKKLNTHSKRISLVYEVVIGNPQKLLKKAISEYKPAMMIVGTRQYGAAPEPVNHMTPFLSHPQPVRPGQPQPVHPVHSPLHRSIFGKSSTSKYFLQYALVPVILVKPFYTIQETLDRPVDSENYFKDWLANIDISHTREKKKKHIFGMRSPSSSRNSSHTSLTEFMHPNRSHENIHDKLAETLQPHESRGRSSPDMFSFHGSRDSSRSRSRSKPAQMPETDQGLNSALDDRARSRSRSRLSRLFSG